MSLTFDGFDLTRYAYVRLDKPVGPRMRIETEQVPGRSGDLVSSIVADTLTITAHCTLKRRYFSQWDRVRMELAKVFTVTEPKVLQLPDEPELYRYATASLNSDVSMPLEPPVTFDIELVCHDPVAYRDEHSVTVPSGGSVTFDVGGLLPARVRIVASAAVRSDSTDLWGLRFDEQDFTRVKLLTSGAKSVDIDCKERVVLVSGATSMITKDSHWIELAPGVHTARMEHGTGAATGSWTERYL